ncbi:DUF2066 domain-containing protein [Maricaulaceae bacterium EIL42A08]|nr:DUF2066 domain-containing protein [Maricaulaceae bacterium EIL42A08]
MSAQTFFQSRLSGLVLAVAAIMALTGGAMAQPFTVKNVEIDATADSAFEAQRQAMSDGQVRAAMTLIERLTLPEDRFEFDPEIVTADVAAELIAGLQIANEQRSATRYRGELTIEFDRRAVGEFFDLYEMAYVESPASPMLAIAISDEGNGPTLSGEWARAWREGAYETALTPFAVYNDREAQSAISVSAALAMDEDALARVAELYGVNAVAVVTARQGGGAVRTGGNMMRFTDEGSVVEPLPSVSARGGFAAAADRFVSERELAWKREAVVRDTEVGELSVTVLYNSLREWRGLQRAVAGAALIQDARLDALSRRGAAMTLVHRGSLEQVTAELAARGAQLEEDADLGWTVRSRR